MSLMIHDMIHKMHSLNFSLTAEECHMVTHESELHVLKALFSLKTCFCRQYCQLLHY